MGGAAGQSFARMWDDLAPIGRAVSTGGYRRFAWTPVDAQLREWFAGEAESRGLDLTLDRAGNQWAWWGSPDATPGLGLVVGSHLDSVPDGGAFDGPLGVISGFAALDLLRENAFVPSRPIAVVNFGDEEGARFGVACAGSRLITGALAADRALGLRDDDGTTMAEALRAAGRDASSLGRDDETLRRIGTFIELHVEQGRGLVELDRPVAVGSSIRAHGRWRIDLPGEANHAGTTRLEDRRDPMLALAALIQHARSLAHTHAAVATIGKVNVEPNGVNAIPSLVTAWLDARAENPAALEALIAEFSSMVGTWGGVLTGESLTAQTDLDTDLVSRIADRLDGAPVMATGAGHDAGILANAGISTAMIFVRNPSGVSHSPAEWAERDDCLAGVEALETVIEDLAR